MSSNPAKIAVGNNSKLGKGFGNFNLPILETCPGATEMCRKVCYGRKGHFAFPVCQNRARLNYEGARRSDFAGTITAQLQRSKMKVIRIHSTGDMFSPRYVREWTRIADACPNIQFGAYTRSWSEPGFVSCLREFSDLPNVQLFCSVDDDTALPPSGFRVSYMIPEWRKIENTLRCPNLVQKSRGVKPADRVTCGKCMICYRPEAKFRDVSFIIH